MADPLATPDDLAGYWRPLTAAESSIAEGLLRVASALVRRRISDVDAQIEAGSLDSTVVSYVVCEMVKSAVESGSRPVDAKSVSETVGPYAHSVTYTATSRLAFTDDLAEMLLPAPAVQIGSARLGAATVPSLPVWSQPCEPFLRRW